MQRWDAELTGAVITLAGMSMLFLTALAATVLGIDVGQYGSPAAALVFAAVGVGGEIFRLRACDDEEIAAGVRAVSLGCIASTTVLLNPMPSIFGQVALVGVALFGLGGIVLAGTVLYRWHSEPV